MNGVAGYAGAIVSPSLTAAIESTRQYLLDEQVLPSDWPTFNGFANWDGSAPNRLDEPSQLIRWEPDSRAAVLTFEAMAGMTFEALGQDPEDHYAATRLKVWGTHAGEEAGPLVLVEMTRPKPDALKQQAGRVVESGKSRLMPKSDSLASRDRLAEIAAQVTPPFAFWCAVLPIHPERMPRTIELINVALSMANYAQQRFKHALAVPRPQYFNPKVFPAILTPSHGSLPSGHATEAFVVANVLSRLMGSGIEGGGNDADASIRRMLMALAARIANNREVAGLHTPIDSVAGRLLGAVLADYLVARCKGGETRHTGCFNGARLFAKDGDLYVRGDNGAEIRATAINDSGLELGTAADPICSFAEGKIKVEKSKALGWLWDRAREEWGPAVKLPPKDSAAVGPK